MVVAVEDKLISGNHFNVGESGGIIFFYQFGLLKA
jgi:hypothetical protein